MAALVEVHERGEMERVARLGAELVGINNRDLRTLEVSLETTRRLIDLRLPECVLVSESGFSQREEMLEMRAWGVDAFLIGESLMRASDPGEAASTCSTAQRPSNRSAPRSITPCNWVRSRNW